MIAAIVNLIIWILVIGILYWVVLYVLDAVAVPDPPARLVKIALTVVFVLILLNLVLGLLGVSTGIDMPKLTPQ